jgi:glycosyltransferase involved in cell wall biosynthesis
MSADLPPLRVLHFVTGGFSGGATQVAIALVQAARAGRSIQPLLVLRRKAHTPKARLDELRASGVPFATVTGFANIATVFALARLCQEFKPDVLIAHGFSEHLWGRYAGLWAKVPHLIHVEHNTRERYSRWRLAQSRWLAKRTAKIVGCSEGVRMELLAQGLPADKVIAIANGIRLEPFAGADDVAYAARLPELVMVARLSKQKDHASLLRALAGGGKERHKRQLLELAQSLGVAAQVRFLGVIRNVPELLIQRQIAVLSTHYEGMPLALLEGMAAGCAVIGSDVPGVREVIHDGVDGRLVAANDPAALADAIEALLRDPLAAAAIASRARARAITSFSRERMNAEYARLCLGVAGRPTQPLRE